MPPISALSRLFPTANIGKPINLSEGANHLAVAYKASGEALCSTVDESLVGIVEAGKDSFIAVGQKTAFFVTPEGVETAELDEEANDNIKGSFKGRKVTDEVFKRVLKAGKVATTRTDFPSSGTAITDFINDEGEVLARLMARKDRGTIYMVGSMSEGAGANYAAVSKTDDGVTSVSANDTIDNLSNDYPDAIIVTAADAKKIRDAINRGDVTKAVWKSLNIKPVNEGFFGSIQIMSDDWEGKLRGPHGDEESMTVTFTSKKNYDGFIRNVRMEYPAIKLATDPAKLVVRVPNRGVSEEIDEAATVMLPAIEANLKKALAAEGGEETREFIKKALAALAKAKGDKVRAVEGRASHPTTVAFKKGQAVKWTAPDGTDETGTVVSDVDERYAVKVQPSGKGREEVLVKRTSLKLDEAAKKDVYGNDDPVNKRVPDDEDDDDEDDDDDDDDGDGDEEMEESIRSAAVELILAANDPDLSAAAVDEALEAKDYGAAVEAIEALASIARLSIPEGLSAKVHKRGRKPSLNSMKRGGGRGPKADLTNSDGSTCLDEGTAQNSADATVPGMAEPIITIKVTANAEHLDDVAALIRDAGGQATQEGETIVGMFLTAERATDAKARIKEKIPDASVNESTETKTEITVAEWIGHVRTMDVEAFAEHVKGLTLTDTAEQLKARVAGLVEAYKRTSNKLPGVKKDMARKITRVNPMIKDAIGKGMDLDESRVSMFAAKNDLDAIIGILDHIGANDDVALKIAGDRVRVTIPESLVAPFKTQAGSIRFTING